MHNIDNVVRIYFNYASVYSIISKEIEYNEFPASEFAHLAKVYLNQYSDTESRQLYYYIHDSIDMEGHPYAGIDSRSGLNVFAALEELAEQLLTMEGDQVRCIYGRLIRFRELTKYLEEDLLVCAYLAVRHKRWQENIVHFNWDITIGHNNSQLNRMMSKGISENHFHLYGSAPSYHLIWIYLMNHVGAPSFIKMVQDMEQRQRSIRTHYKWDYTEEAFWVRLLKAALIRVVLVYWLVGWETQDVLPLELIEQLLTGAAAIEAYTFEIQKLIDYLQEYVVLQYGYEMPDYALYKVNNFIAGSTEFYEIGGERWITYHMLCQEMSDRNVSSLMFQWFYAYLVIKHSLRGELLQVNDTVGFENFAIYNKRKGAFFDRRMMLKYAVFGSLKNGNIKSLEMRIIPGYTAEENARLISDINNIIAAEEKEGLQGLLDKSSVYYVFHFTKCMDDPLPPREYFSGLCCRHFNKRNKLNEQANAIWKFRDNYPATASWVLGIDACSQEIGCRPEVFASVFRFLSNHIHENLPGEHVRQLKMTYHVGEDFLDIVDGLRAMDEAVKFLNLQCGDRIGHGTVLGLNVEKWYAHKQNTIILSQQDYMDNVVWLYHKISEFRLNGFENLCKLLEQEFDAYFAEIFSPSIKKTGFYNINTYYEAWKLRGDAPELYQEGDFRKSFSHWIDDYLVNYKCVQDFGIRRRSDVGHLYYLYHYDWDVRNKGKKMIEIHIPTIYVDGVTAVQKAMQKEFSSFGIGIETNPSSNLSISTLQTYGEHPIVQLYNKDLLWDEKRKGDCAQINVSINTDDKGVFHTSLENEYALMACALEKVRDDDEHAVYNRQMIYQWLDNIREMGNMQSFKE